MRLTCPNCAAIYEVADTAVPAGGTHVQCSACHTRWFARAQAPAAEAPSEDEIITRLETRAARPRPAPAGPGAVPIAFPGGAQLAREPAIRPEHPFEAEPAPKTEPPAERILRPAPEQKLVPEPTPGIAATQPAPEEAAVLTPLRPRPGLERPPLATQRVEPELRSRFWPGFLLAVVVPLVGLGVYLQAEVLRAQVPQAAPYLDSYVDRVDAARDLVEAQLGPLRDRALGR